MHLCRVRRLLHSFPTRRSSDLFLSGRNGAPQRATLAADSPKAEASFTHSKRCREVRLLLQTLRLPHGPRCHDARSVWSARSLLPLCDETIKTVRRVLRSPRLTSTKT